MFLDVMFNKKYDFIIVGSGLYGLTFNYLARKNGYKCLIVEKRPHIGGNIYTPIIDGIPIHQYGPHIFHTSNKKVWDFVCSLCKMNSFINSPIAIYKDEVYNLPFNMNTFSKMFNVIKPQEVEDIINNEIKQHNIIEPSNFEEQAISMVGDTVYQKLIKEYTEKQWGRDCKELSSTIIKRLPYRLTFDNNYFNDTYQGVPEKGYQELIDSLLGDTEVVFSDYLSNKKIFNSLGEYVVYTGPIDAYFNYSEGCLEWRSCRFETEKKDVRNFQGNAIVNYTSHDVPYTRIIEHKFFDKSLNVFNENYTYISKEFPVEWEKGMEPFYPINNDANMARYQLYKEKALQEQNVVFGGRLGTYTYNDMDDTILNAMNDFKQLIENIENLKIWVISHKDGDNLFEYDKYHSFIHVGADINPDTKHLIKDNTGDNISIKNPNYCELTGIYWVWKNALKTKYVGFEHYRRHWGLNKTDIENFLREKKNNHKY